MLISGVCTAPGTATDTPMRCLARSKRSTSDSPRNPYLLALYAACQGSGTSPAAEDTLTRRPPSPAATMGGTNVSMTWIGPIRLIATILVH